MLGSDSLRLLMRLKPALEAYHRKDWDALASCVMPLLPPVPDDGSGFTHTPERAAFAAILTELGGPVPLQHAAFRYLTQTTDGQLRMLAAHVHRLADAMPRSVPVLEPSIEERATRRRAQKR